VLVTVCYVLKYSGDCSVVMPWWVVGKGNVVTSCVTAEFCGWSEKGGGWSGKVLRGR